MDGSQSYDDHGIVEYEWSRDPKSPAAGVSAMSCNLSQLRMKLKKATRLRDLACYAIFLWTCVTQARFFLSSYFHFFSVLLILQDVINNSDRQAVLRLSNLVEGMYKFKLTVADGKGLKGSDVVLLTVREGMISC